MTVGRRAAGKVWKPNVGDRVMVHDDEGVPVFGTIKKMGEAKSVVASDTGPRWIIRNVDLAKIPTCKCSKPATKPDGLCDSCRPFEDAQTVDRYKSGFNGNIITWSNDKAFCKFDTDNGIHCYGMYRKNRIHTRGEGEQIVHVIDLFATHKGTDYTINSLVYYKDPREAMQSLNADIVAATQRWAHINLQNGAETIDSLKMRANKPTIHVNRIQTLDRMILQLKEVREVAIRCGGARLVQFMGDTETSPPLTVTIDVTKQALLLEGKVPPINEAGHYDIAQDVRRGDKTVTAIRPEKHHADPGTIKALVKRLGETKDKAGQRKIRALLREMGHKGGARALKAKPQPEQEITVEADDE